MPVREMRYGRYIVRLCLQMSRPLRCYVLYAVIVHVLTQIINLAALNEEDNEQKNPSH